MCADVPSWRPPSASGSASRPQLLRAPSTSAASVLPARLLRLRHCFPHRGSPHCPALAANHCICTPHTASGRNPRTGPTARPAADLGALPSLPTLAHPWDPHRCSVSKPWLPRATDAEDYAWCQVSPVLLSILEPACQLAAPSADPGLLRAASDPAASSPPLCTVAASASTRQHARSSSSAACVICAGHCAAGLPAVLSGIPAGPELANPPRVCHVFALRPREPGSNSGLS